jgi:hypothetical protein
MTIYILVERSDGIHDHIIGVFSAYEKALDVMNEKGRKTNYDFWIRTCQLDEVIQYGID